jgi:hypothetical protein
MTNLREARDTGKLADFISEREAEAAPDGDEAALNRTLAAMAGTSKAVPAASKPDRSAG